LPKASVFHLFSWVNSTWDLKDWEKSPVSGTANLGVSPASHQSKFFGLGWTWTQIKMLGKKQGDMMIHCPNSDDSSRIEK